MDAGATLDAKIASTLWGAFVVLEDGEFYTISIKKRLKVKLPAYSTNVEDAYRIVKAFQEKGWFFRVVNEPKTNSFYASFSKTSTPSDFINAKTLPLAICEAALKTGEKMY